VNYLKLLSENALFCIHFLVGCGMLWANIS